MAASFLKWILKKYRDAPHAASAAEGNSVTGYSYCQVTTKDGYQERRKDILCYVEQSVYGLNRAIIWKDLETGEYLDHCPFLLRIDAKRYECAIQDTKPKICRMFWCAWAYREGNKGVPFKTLNGWAEKARKLGYKH